MTKKSTKQVHKVGTQKDAYQTKHWCHRDVRQNGGGGERMKQQGRQTHLSLPRLALDETALLALAFLRTLHIPSGTRSGYRVHCGCGTLGGIEHMGGQHGTRLGASGSEGLRKASMQRGPSSLGISHT